MSKVKLLVCYHKKSELLKDDIFTPIHVGRAIVKNNLDVTNKNYSWLMHNCIGDDTGENISHKNGTYNEMTSLYWAWKNYDVLGNPDYIGLMHYRRHFILKEGEMDVVHFDNMGVNYLDEINYSPKKMDDLLKGCDFVTHIGKVNNVYKHYLENHRQEDIDLAFQILYEKYPEYKEYAKDYFAQDYSNFCNMFIFKKEIFFDYCEWIFDILGEFENRADCSEKRFFISERLTGVYIYKLMQNTKLIYKVVPISFVADECNVPIFMPLSVKNQFPLANSLVSLFENKKPASKYEVSLLTDTTITEDIKSKFINFEKKYTGISINIVSVDVEEQYYPLIVSELFNKVNKAIYMTDSVTILGDITELFRCCSVDDYQIIGANKNKYNIYDKVKEINSEFLILNCKSIRKKNIFMQVTGMIKQYKDIDKIIETIFAGQTNYIPWYYITVASAAAENVLFDPKKTRGSYTADAVWKPIMLYDNRKPWMAPQDVYSIFWWDFVPKVPLSFPYVGYSAIGLEKYLSDVQKEINKLVKSQEQNITVNEIIQEKPSEEWREYSFWEKLKFYYIHNGLKQTIKYGFCKLTRGRK